MESPDWERSRHGSRFFLQCSLFLRSGASMCPWGHFLPSSLSSGVSELSGSRHPRCVRYASTNLYTVLVLSTHLYRVLVTELSRPMPAAFRSTQDAAQATEATLLAGLCVFGGAILSRLRRLPLPQNHSEF